MNELFEYASRKIKDPPCEIAPRKFNNPNHENLRLKTEQWIKQNPRAYDLYKQFARDLLRKGRKFSAKLITERIRWEYYFNYDEEFKISNDYTAYIARRLCEDIPELQSILKFKKTRW